MPELVMVSCPMDCFDLCRFIVTIENGKVVNLAGDPDHPVTRGVICKKGKALVKRLYHPDRLTRPLVREAGGFREASYDEVFDRIAAKLDSVIREYGTRAILNYTSDGYGGMKNRIQSIFFNCLGGVSEPEGSLCWGAGMAAQNYDFGSARGHYPEDVLNADFIIVWGRNPKNTSIHQHALLKAAQKKGSRIVVIDPVKTDTARAFEDYIRIRPSTDGALALAMAAVIMDEGLHDQAFVDSHVTGFNRFREYACGFTPERAGAITGIPAETIRTLAREYGRAKTACIYVGLGMQRYRNGGNAVRCIDALGAITGRIGKKGCGVNYAAKAISPYLAGPYRKSAAHAANRRRFVVGRLGEFLETVADPPIKVAFVAFGNPLTQSPDLEKTVQNFKQIEFKVVFDHVMTDTARYADIVIPAAFVFEQEDLFSTSMYSPVLNFSRKAVDPPEDLLPEFEFYMELARRMKLDNLGFKSSTDYLEKCAQPFLDKVGIAFETLSGTYPTLEGNGVAWSDLKFETPSGKIELYSETALKDGLSPLPEFFEPIKGGKDYPLRLLTCHSIDSMHSQGFAFNDDTPMVYVNPETAVRFGVQGNPEVILKAETGQLRVRLSVDDAVGEGTAFMHQGWWHKSGAVNFLTSSVITDMGKQAAFYDSFVTLEKL